MKVFIVDEFSREFDLLFNNSLSPIKTKLGDRLAPNVLRKRGKPRKLRNNKEL